MNSSVLGFVYVLEINILLSHLYMRDKVRQAALHKPQTWQPSLPRLFKGQFILKELTSIILLSTRVRIYVNFHVSNVIFRKFPFIYKDKYSNKNIFSVAQHHTCCFMGKKGPFINPNLMLRSTENKPAALLQKKLGLSPLISEVRLEFTKQSLDMINNLNRI